MATAPGTVQYDANTGAKLAPGATTTQGGKTYTQGQVYSGGGTSSSGGTTSGRVTGYGGLTYDPSRPLSGTQATKRATEIVNPLTDKAPSEMVSDKPLTPIDVKTGASNINNFDPNTGKQLAAGQTVLDQTTGKPVTQGTKFQQAFSQLQGTPAPVSAGAASSAVQQAVSQVAPPQQNTSMVDQAMAADPLHQQLLKDQADYNSVANQGASLLKFYDQSITKAGIPGIDKELLNTKKIIDGTEDDIRKEVQAVGGFATESQVLALAGARNKQLILNYNNLLDEKKMTMENINTRMNLAQQDRNFALQTISQRMQWDQQEMAYRDKFVANAQEGYNAVLKAVGYAGLYQSLQATGDPNTISTAERTMGLAPGQLKALASRPMDAMDQLDLQLKQSQLNNSRLQGQQLQQGLSTGGAGAQAPISPYQEERAYRTVQSVDELGTIAQQNPGIFGRSAAFPLPDFLRSDAFRNFESQLNTLKSNIAFGELTAMREASKSGGALGQISDTEEKLLSSSLGALSMSQSPENFQAQLQKIKDSINRWHQAMGMTGSSQPTITAPDGTQVIITD